VPSQKYWEDSYGNEKGKQQVCKEVSEPIRRKQEEHEEEKREHEVSSEERKQEEYREKESQQKVDEEDSFEEVRIEEVRIEEVRIEEVKQVHQQINRTKERCKEIEQEVQLKKIQSLCQ
jgi:hypothetical protein